MNPIARYLNRSLDIGGRLEIGASGSVLRLVRGGKVREVNLPLPVQVFLDGFHRGLYPPGGGLRPSPLARRQGKAHSLSDRRCVGDATSRPASVVVAAQGGHWTFVGRSQGGGFGPTVQLEDGTLVTSYSYRDGDDRTRLEVVRWRLPPPR